jgi:hypothetical protein
MISLHFPLLLLAAFLPYATSVMGHYPGNPLAALLLGLVIGALLACRSAIQNQAARDDVLLPEVGARLHRADVTVSRIVIRVLDPDLGAGVVDAVGGDPVVHHRGCRRCRTQDQPRSAAGEAEQARTVRAVTPRVKGDSHDADSFCVPDGR